MAWNFGQRRFEPLLGREVRPPSLSRSLFLRVGVRRLKGFWLLMSGIAFVGMPDSQLRSCRGFEVECLRVSGAFGLRGLEFRSSAFEGTVMQ